MQGIGTVRMRHLNFRFRRLFRAQFAVERIPEIPSGSVLPRIGDGCGPALHVRPYNGTEFFIVLPHLGRMAPHVMTLPNPRKMLLSMGPLDWLIDIDKPALDKVDLPRGLSGLRPFGVQKLGLYIMFDGSRVMAFDERGTHFDFHYRANVTNVELLNERLIVTWWPNAQGKWVDHIDLVSGKRILSQREGE